MVEVKRKKGETFDALLRRFQRRHQQSGRSLQVKKVRYRTSAPSKTRTHSAALRREEKRQEYEYLYKTGQLKEEPKKKMRR